MEVIKTMKFYSTYQMTRYQCFHLFLNLFYLFKCTDDGKKAAHRAKLSKAKEVAEKKEKKENAQEDAQTVAAWQFLGAKTDQLWLLVRTYECGSVN